WSSQTAVLAAQRHNGSVAPWGALQAPVAAPHERATRAGRFGGEALDLVLTAGPKFGTSRKKTRPARPDRGRVVASTLRCKASSRACWRRSDACAATRSH